MDVFVCRFAYLKKMHKTANETKSKEKKQVYNKEPTIPRSNPFFESVSFAEQTKLMDVQGGS